MGSSDAAYETQLERCLTPAVARGAYARADDEKKRWMLGFSDT